MLIPCPHCGPRPMAEFTYGGAALTRPENPSLADRPDPEWDAFVYERVNPAGPHEECWFHAAACRGWFRLTRDTRTNQCLETQA